MALPLLSVRALGGPHRRVQGSNHTHRPCPNERRGDRGHAAFDEQLPRSAREHASTIAAAFLFRSSGQPVARRDFEATLEKTDALLGERGGPFFAGESPTAPDVCWARVPRTSHAAQLPLLHDGLRPRDRRASSPEPLVRQRWSLRSQRMAVARGRRLTMASTTCSSRRRLRRQRQGRVRSRSPTTGPGERRRGVRRVALTSRGRRTEPIGPGSRRAPTRRRPRPY